MNVTVECNIGYLKMKISIIRDFSVMCALLINIFIYIVKHIIRNIIFLNYDYVLCNILKYYREGDHHYKTDICSEGYLVHNHSRAWSE